MNPAHLLTRAAECGYRVEVDETGPHLVRVVEGAVLPSGLYADLKRHRESVVAHLTVCAVCRRDVSDRENRDRLVDPAFCDRAGSREVVTRSGTVVHPETPRCPYKPN
jgi:hypothetical protein